jgi:hypothetical protein
MAPSMVPKSGFPMHWCKNGPKLSDDASQVQANAGLVCSMVFLFRSGPYDTRFFLYPPQLSSLQKLTVPDSEKSSA